MKNDNGREKTQGTERQSAEVKPHWEANFRCRVLLLSDGSPYVPYRLETVYCPVGAVGEQIGDTDLTAGAYLFRLAMRAN